VLDLSVLMAVEGFSFNLDVLLEGQGINVGIAFLYLKKNMKFSNLGNFTIFVTKSLDPDPL
jgi:hypothetical protein